MALLGGGILFGYAVIAIFAPWITPYNPVKQDLRFSLDIPSTRNLLGRDELGRDILSRLIYGTRISISIAISAVWVGLLVGVPFGLISGFWGGKIDFIIQRLTDTMLAFPGFLLALALVSVIGVGFKNVVVSIGISSVPMYIRAGKRVCSYRYGSRPMWRQPGPWGREILPFFIAISWPMRWSPLSCNPLWGWGQPFSSLRGWDFWDWVSSPRRPSGGRC